MRADGGEAIADLAVLRDQAELFGSVASDPAAWRVLLSMDNDALDRLRAARAAAREVVWAQITETRGRDHFSAAKRGPSAASEYASRSLDGGTNLRPLDWLERRGNRHLPLRSRTVDAPPSG